MFYSSDALYVLFERLLIAIVIPLGMFFAFLRPRQTWPAVLWVGSGLLAFFGTYLGCYIYSS